MTGCGLNPLYIPRDAGSARAPEVHARLILKRNACTDKAPIWLVGICNERGKRPPGNCARVNCYQWCACFCLCRFSWASNGGPLSASVLFASVVVVDSSTQVYPDRMPLANKFESFVSVNEVLTRRTLIVGPWDSVLLVVRLVEGKVKRENVREGGEKRKRGGR